MRDGGTLSNCCQDCCSSLPPSRPHHCGIFYKTEAIMGDSWEDEDFELPVAPPVALKNDWEDEVDEAQVEIKKAPVQLTAAQIEANRKKALEADEALAMKVKLATLANETPDERRLRERRQAEEADNELAGELFDSHSQKSGSVAGNSSTRGLGSVSLKTKQDHSSFGTATAAKLADSTTFNVGAFFKNLVKVLDTPSVTAETLDDILADINKIRDTKAKAAKAVVGKKSKKDIKGIEKKHNDVFGGSDYVDKYEDSYGGMEDDFM